MAAPKPAPNSRRLTAVLRASSPDRASRASAAAIDVGCEVKNGLSHPTRTAASHENRMTANDATPSSAGFELPHRATRSSSFRAAVVRPSPNAETSST